MCRLVDNLAAMSIVTATVYLKNLGLYYELNKIDPRAFVKGLVWTSNLRCLCSMLRGLL